MTTTQGRGFLKGLFQTWGFRDPSGWDSHRDTYLRGDHQEMDPQHRGIPTPGFGLRGESCGCGMTSDSLSVDPTGSSYRGHTPHLGYYTPSRSIPHGSSPSMTTEGKTLTRRGPRECETQTLPFTTPTPPSTNKNVTKTRVRR